MLGSFGRRSLGIAVAGAVAVVSAGAVASAHGFGGPSSRGSTDPARICRQLAAGDTRPGVLSALTTAQLTQLKADCLTLTAAEATQRTADKAAALVLRSVLRSLRAPVKAACVPTGTTGTTGTTGSTGATGATGPSAACLTALKAERKAGRAAERFYLHALKTAAGPVITATKTVGADLAADAQANGPTGPTGVTGSTGPHGHHHRGRRPF